MSERRTPNATLIAAVRILSRTIQTEDGVIPACLAEVATRLEALVEERLTTNLTPKELEAVREAGENWRHTSYTPYRDLGVTLRALADRVEVVTHWRNRGPGLEAKEVGK